MSGVRLQSWVMSLFLGLFLARSRQFLARSRLFSASWGQVAVLGSSWAHFGAVLGLLGSKLGPWAASWGEAAILGASWGRLGGDLGGKLGPSGRLGRVLGASWGRLGASWTRFWRQDGTKNRSAKTIKILKLFQDRFLEPQESFWSQHVQMLVHLGNMCSCFGALNL